MHRLISLLVVLASCASTGPKFDGTLHVTDPRLVTINPDVKAVVDANQPVFFVRGAYWMFYDGRWWRASTLASEWTHAAKPPVPVRQIEEPYEYVHYRVTTPTQVARRP